MTDREEAYEEKREKVVREKALNVGIVDEKMHMNDDESGREGDPLSDHNQKVSIIKIVT